MRVWAQDCGGEFQKRSNYLKKVLKIKENKNQTNKQTNINNTPLSTYPSLSSYSEYSRTIKVTSVKVELLFFGLWQDKTGSHASTKISTTSREEGVYYIGATFISTCLSGWVSVPPAEKHQLILLWVRHSPSLSQVKLDEFWIPKTALLLLFIKFIKIKFIKMSFNKVSNGVLVSRLGCHSHRWVNDQMGKKLFGWLA